MVKRITPAVFLIVTPTHGKPARACQAGQDGHAASSAVRHRRILIECLDTPTKLPSHTFVDSERRAHDDRRERLVASPSLDANGTLLGAHQRPPGAPGHRAREAAHASATEDAAARVVAIAAAASPARRAATRIAAAMSPAAGAYPGARRS